MKRPTGLRLTVSILIAALLMGSLPPAQRGVLAQAGPFQTGGRSIHLPLVSAPLGPPDFTIVSPAEGLAVSGTSFFAVQALGPTEIATVSFRAGVTELGTDSTANDGFQVFLDAGQLPAGALQLAATATSPTGATTTKTINVTVVPAPPASATVGTGGATLATASGSTIVVPPGAVPGDATISVEDKTQEQVTAEKGINWDALGVTFLGAIDVQSTAPLAKPLGVSSVGFGNRIQPGQAVVTYRILPDADGDGVGELVVVNGANLAPNGTIVSSPVPEMVVNGISAGTGTRSNLVQSAGTGQEVLHGPPGTMITIDGSGFNPLSMQGNVGSWTSLVDGEVIELPGLPVSDPTDSSSQVLSTLIPPLAAGDATLTLVNRSTGSTAGPFHVIVEEPAPLDRPAAEVFDLFLADTIDYLEGIPTSTPEQAASLSLAIDAFTQSRTDLQALVAAGMTPIEAQALETVALMLANSDIYQVGTARAAGMTGYTLETATSDALSLMGGIALLLGGIALLVPSATLFVAFVAGFSVGVGAMIVAYFACRAFGGGTCFDEPAPPPAACTPTATASDSGTTGMGSAPPPGGDGCGNAGGSPPNSVQSASLAQLESGRFIVKIFPLAGGRLLTPFTGATDPGGYFYIPLIPQGEPFRALATDQLTGASVSVEGVGPATGESTLMYFDFTNAQQNRYDIAIGDTVTNGMPGPGAGNIEEAGGLDIYNFSATAGQQVFFDLVGGAEALTHVNWQLLAPDGEVLFDRVLFCCGNGDPGVYTLEQAGTYTIKVGDDTDAGIGTYGFTLWNVPPPNQFAFAINDTISNGVPGAGAGNIESPGVKDIYTFNATAGQQIFVDLVEGVSALTQVDWQMLAPDGEVIFDRVLFCCGNGDPGVHTLEQAGTYTITVGDDIDNSTGTYGFKLWTIPAPEHFVIAIDDTISNGVPGPGAGSIESPGVKDIYTFDATAGQQIFVDLVEGVSALTQVDWQMLAPNGEVVFDRVLFCCGNGDPGVHTLAQAGTYTITVGDDTDNSIGTYGFKMWTVPTPDHFVIAIGDTVSDGVPGAGAGNIESPGVKDIYTFNATVGQQVFFDLIGGVPALTQVDWQLLAPDGEVIFDRVLFCCGNGDPGEFTLGQTGIYTITVGDNTNSSTGTYGFEIREP